MRLFFAVDTPSNTFPSLQQTFSAPGVVLSSHFHCTLKFLGDIPEDQVPFLRECVSSFTFSPFTVQFSRLGVFPNHHHIRVLYAGLEPVEPLETLHRRLDALLPQYPSDRSFIPHVTLARVNYLADKPAFLRKLDQSLPLEEIPVTQVTLYQSILHRDGPQYRVVDVFGAQK